MIEKIEAGCYILVIGMGTVFIFLAIMIFVMEMNAKAMKLINKYWPEENNEEKNLTKKRKSTDNKDTEVALAITCALHERTAK